MKIAHLADLHLGKIVNGYSMIDDQKYILRQILEIFKKEAVDCVCIAGDVYDKTVPAIEAMELLDSFLYALNREKIEVFMIAGNHDSPQRLSFASDLLKDMHVHIVGTYDGHLNCVDLKDAYGFVHFYMLPYIRVSNVNRYIEAEEEKVHSYDSAVKYVIDHACVDTTERNVILSHQFVVGSVVDVNGSEELSLGGTDQVSGENYSVFDYVALGHIHRPQKLLRETMRYSGTPLKYSFSECRYEKSLVIVEMKEKGNISLKQIPLKPFHEMREIRGTFQEVAASHPDDDSMYDYMHITLLDETDVTDAIQTLRTIYPNIMKLDYDNQRTRAMLSDINDPKLPQKSMLEIFEDFYQQRCNKQLNEEGKKVIEECISSLGDED